MANKPNIRFEGVTDDWEQRKLGELCERVTRKNKNGESDLPLTIASQYGLIDQRDFFNKVVAAKDMSNYYLLKKGEFAYNKSYSNGFDYGSIKRLNAYEQGCLSTLYICFGITSDDIDSDYLECFFDTLKWYSDITMICAEGARNHGLLNVDTKAFFDEVTIEMPSSKEEQRKISAYLNNLDNLITLHQRKCDETKELKKYMLQKMFPKNGEKVPEIRFAGFNDDWEQRKVSEVAEIVAGGTPSTKISNYWEPKEVPWLSSGEVHKKYITFTDNMISQEGMNNSSAKMIKENSVLIALAGQGKTRGTVAINRIPLTTNQSIAAMTFNDDIVPEFIFCNLENRYDEIRKMSSGDGARGGLNKQLVGDIEIPYTSYEEQKKIGTYFEQLDNLITLHQRKCDETKELKTYMLQNMFPTKG